MFSSTGNKMKYTFRKKKPNVYHIGIGNGTACKMQNGRFVRLKYKEAEQPPHGVRLCVMCGNVTSVKTTN